MDNATVVAMITRERIIGSAHAAFKVQEAYVLQAKQNYRLPKLLRK